MKLFGKFMFLVLISLLCATVASAQNGAVIIRDEAAVGVIEWNGENVLAVLSSDSLYFCEDELDIVPCKRRRTLTLTVIKKMML